MSGTDGSLINLKCYRNYKNLFFLIKNNAPTIPLAYTSYRISAPSCVVVDIETCENDSDLFAKVNDSQSSNSAYNAMQSFQMICIKDFRQKLLANLR